MNKKYIFLVGMSWIFLGNIVGCGQATRGQTIEKQYDSDQEYAMELFEEVVEALESEDEEAIKELFSPYAIENSENLDEKIEELIEFYPGCNGGYEMVVPTHESIEQYGSKEYIIYPKYHVTNDGELYDLRLTVYIENEAESQKEGIYSMQVMTNEAWTEGFKWRNEEDAPGVYVLE